MYIHLHGLAQPRGHCRNLSFQDHRRQSRCPPIRRYKKWCPELRKIRSDTCASYQPQEIAISHTASGHLTPDVVLVPPGPLGPNGNIRCRYLIIRDFGVDWRHVKLAARNRQLFKDMLNRFEADKSLLFRIVGYSDLWVLNGITSFYVEGEPETFSNS